ncbi:hypothetical protein FRC11_013633 [Ceratobasidium sp. 423]|nr:hypothetical protein FRC11_013633 [Ceratobasidium sp. 423]
MGSLIKWISDLIQAAEAVTKGEVNKEAGSLGKQVRKYTEKCEQMEQDNEVKANAKKVEEAAQTERAKKKTVGNWEWDPEDLEDDPPLEPKTMG